MPKEATYRKHKWMMLNGNQQWVSDIALADIDKIYEFLEGKYLAAKNAGKRVPEYTYSKISEGTGVYKRSVPYLCRLLAFKVDPVVRIRCGNFKEKVCEKVKLLRVVDD